MKIWITVCSLVLFMICLSSGLFDLAQTQPIHAIYCLAGAIFWFAYVVNERL